jgi:hypothetical protein
VFTLLQIMSNSDMMVEGDVGDSCGSISASSAEATWTPLDVVVALAIGSVGGAIWLLGGWLVRALRAPSVQSMAEVATQTTLTVSAPRRRSPSSAGARHRAEIQSREDWYADRSPITSPRPPPSDYDSEDATPESSEAVMSDFD